MFRRAARPWKSGLPLVIQPAGCTVRLPAVTGCDGLTGEATPCSAWQARQPRWPWHFAQVVGLLRASML